jgi:hypothetical protein
MKTALKIFIAFLVLVGMLFTISNFLADSAAAQSRPPLHKNRSIHF